MFLSYFSVYANAGQKTRVTFPPSHPTTLLFVRRYKFSDKANSNKTINIYLQSAQKQQNNKEKLIAFQDDANDIATLNLTINPDSIISFIIDGEGSGIRFFFGTNSVEAIQFKPFLTQSLTKAQQNDVAKELLAEIERAFRSEDPFMVLLLVFEKYFPSSFSNQNKSKFPKIIQNILNTSLKRLNGEITDYLSKLIYFINFRLSLKEKLTEALGIIFITMLNNIEANKNALIDEIRQQCYDTAHFIEFQTLFTFSTKTSLIDESFLMPISLVPVSNIDFLSLLYNYAIGKKTKINFTYLNLFSQIASENELKMVFKSDQIIGYSISKEREYKIFKQQLSSLSVFEKLEGVVQPRKTISFSPQKMGSPQKEDNSNNKTNNNVKTNNNIDNNINVVEKPKAKLSMGNIGGVNLPFVETLLDKTETQLSIEPEPPKYKLISDEGITILSDAASAKENRFRKIDFYTVAQFSGIIILFILILFSQYIFI